MNQLNSTTRKITIAEIAVLLILPLPFLKLNAIYVVSALVIMLISKYLRKEKWSEYGFRSMDRKNLLIATIIGIIFGFADNFLVEPLVTRLTGAEPDLSSYEGVKGSIPGLIAMLALGWIVGGLFEELFFRGYLFKRFRSLIADETVFRIVAIILTSVVFAFAHNYQGIAGIVSTFYFAVIMGLLYLYFKGNIWYLVLVHGFFDTVGIFRLYLGA